MRHRARALLGAWSAPLAAAVALRLLSLLHPHLIDTDGAYYGAVARWFAAGHWAKALDPVWPPLYPLLLSGFVRLGIPVEAAGIAVSMVASLACVCTSAGLARAIGGARAGVAAAWLAAVHPKLVAFSLQLLTEMTYAAFASAALWILAVRARRSTLQAACAGACLGAAFLVRPEALALLVPTLAWVLWSNRPRAARPHARRAAACMAGFACMALPYIASVSHLEGRFTPGEKGALNFYLTYRDVYTADGIPVQPADFAAITAPETPRRPGDYKVGTFLRRHPGTVLRHAAANVPKALFDKLPGLVGWPLFALAVAGVVVWRRDARFRPSLLWAAWIATIAASITPIFLYRRFFVAAIPPCIAWGALALEAAWGRWPRRPVTLGFAALLLGLVISNQTRLGRAQPPLLYRDAGLALRARAGEGVVVAARKPETAFYAAAQFRPLEGRDWAALRAFLEREQVTHVVVEDYILPNSHPGLVGLLQPEQAPGWLTLLHEACDTRHRVLVYAFTP